MLRSLHLQDIGPAKELELVFAPRVNLLTGDNGLGKTFLLDIAWGVLRPFVQTIKARPDLETAKEPRITADNGASRFTLHYDFKKQLWDMGGTISLDSDVVLFAQVDGCFSIWDPVKDPSLHFDSSEVFDGLEWNGRTVCNGLIRDVVTWRDRNNEQIEMLAKALEKLSPDPQETLRLGDPIRVSPADAREIPTLRLPYGRIPVDIAPAGMRRVLSLAYLLVWAWSEHRAAAALVRREPARNLVLLIDEIDSHLHPQWQRVILPALMAVVEELAPTVQLQMIASTHSPLVLASAEPFFDDDLDALFHFDLHEGKVKLTQKDWRPRGDVSAWLTSDIFQLGEARSVEAKEAIEKAKAAFLRPNLSLDELREIHRELNAVLKDTDPFWRRWVAHAEKAGIDP
jgi:hypothetical protein